MALISLASNRGIWTPSKQNQFCVHDGDSVNLSLSQVCSLAPIRSPLCIRNTGDAQLIQQAVDQRRRQDSRGT